MGSNDSGIIQSPFDPVVPTPSATEGDQGVGGGIPNADGPNGLTSIPWSGAFVPTPTPSVESGPFGNPSRMSTVDGSTHEGETLAGDITLPPLNTIDKK